MAEESFLRFAAKHLALSHAQLAQDLWVLWLLGKKDGWFVEIGGFDGVTLSNTLLLEQQGWDGLLVEPMPVHFETLVSARSCSALNCAVGTSASEESAFRQVRDAPELSRLEDVVPDDMHEAANKRDDHEVISTRTITIEQALQAANAPTVIDYLSLDTEGNELEILQTFPFDERTVRCLTVEHNQSPLRQTQIDELLAGHGYVPVFPEVSRWDGWYAKPETLAAAGSTPVSIAAVDGPAPVVSARQGQIQLGRSLLAHNLDAEAAIVVDLVADADHTNLPMLQLRQSLAERKGEPAAIGQANEAITAVAPQLPMPAIKAAVWRRSCDEPDEALAILNRCTSDHPAVFGTRGDLLLALGRNEEALGAFEQALELDTALPQAIRGRTVALRQLQRPADALRNLRQHSGVVAELPWFNHLLLACTIDARADRGDPFVLPDPASDDFDGRVELAAIGSDIIVEPSTSAKAGSVVIDDSGRWQTMFNGIEVPADGYYGAWMTDLLSRTSGRHEPQEEHVFRKVLEYLRPGSTMIELGAYWAFYSTWFSSHLEHKAELVCVEPDSENLVVGQRTLDRNGVNSKMIQGRTGPIEGDIAKLAERGQVAPPQLTIHDLIESREWSRLTILHADIQGAERHLMVEIAPLLKAEAIDFLFVSTHGRPHHLDVLRSVRDTGYHLLAEHSMAESFSCDGLIVASRPGIDGPGYVNVPVR